MKKILLTVICLLLVALCLVGCADYSAQINKINKLLNANYSKLNLTVTVMQDLDELTSTFDVTYHDDDSSTITFNIQRMSTFEDNGAIPDNFITTYSGSATVKDGHVTSVSGDVPADVQLAGVGANMVFSENYLKHVNVNGSTLTAKVSKPQAFMGQADFSCKANSMLVTVNFTTSSLNYVRIQYVSMGGAQVVLTYTFTA